MQIEDVSRIRFASRRTMKQQGHLSVRDSLFREVIIYNQSISALFHKIFADSCTREWSKKLQCCWSRRRSGNDDCVFHRASFRELCDELRRLRLLLTYRHVDADRARRLRFAFLVDNSVNRDARLAGSAITDYELTLTAPNRNHRVNGLDTGMQRYVHRSTVHHSVRL